MKQEAPSIALIFGGRGFEHEVSIRGAEYVFPLIDLQNYRKIPIYIKKDGTWIAPALRDLPCCPRALSDEAVPIEECYPVFEKSGGGLRTATSFIPILSVFPLLHGDYGEDGTVQGALECASIPYVGCNAQTSAMTRDKGYVKLIARELGIPTAKWVYVTEKNTAESIAEAERRLTYPMFVKPARLGSSVGAKIAKCRDDLKSALERALSLGSGYALIEDLVDIEKELECGFFSTKNKELFTNIGEISCGADFYDYETKYLLNTAKISSHANIKDTEAIAIRSYSEKLGHALGLRGLSRIDFFLTKEGKIYFNEINTMPGFTEASLYPRLVGESGITPKELINQLLSDAAEAASVPKNADAIPT